MRSYIKCCGMVLKDLSSYNINLIEKCSLSSEDESHFINTTYGEMEWCIRINFILQELGHLMNLIGGRRD